jgi:hypothetical protein
MTTISSAPDAAAEEPAENEGNRLTKLDLLFVVDNSASMASKQVALREQLPPLMQRLASGDRFPGDPEPFRAIEDMHIGVVSSDMGIAGVTSVQGCAADGGDDGRLQRHGDCGGPYPRFLSYARPSVTSVDDIATDLSCMTTLGTGGCGLSQPLDAALKALTTRNYVDTGGNLTGQNPFTFVSTTPDGTRGRGDRENLDFLRREGDSLLAIIVVTDGDDCSLRDTSSFQSDSDLRMHCALHKDRLFDVEARFYEGLRALRPGRGDDVIFAAIAGVPADLASVDVQQQVAWQDAASRDAYYASILTDPRMGQALRASCVGQVSDSETTVEAFPPRRIVELAQLFGQNSVLQSICQDDLGPAIDVIASLIQQRMRNP